MGGSPEEPIVSCGYDKCVMDFGDFQLENVPRNIFETVTATGTSG
jgi:hypothetical protein